METLWALLLLALVLQGGWALVATHRRAALGAAFQAEGLETIRTTAWLLAEELAGGRPGEDWRVEEGDSVGLRAFRGVAVVVPASREEGPLQVCFRGIRAPNADKDSILLLARSGGWTVHRLLARAPRSGACPHPGLGKREEWTLDPPVATGVLARLFERGSYHLAEGAFRYRRGLEGRQPLTPLRIPRGGLKPGIGDSPPLIWTVFLSGKGGDADTLPWAGSVR